MRSFGVILFVSASIATTQTAALAQPAGPEQTVSIDTPLIDRLVAEARTNNPSLKAADSRVRAAVFNERAVRAWEDPSAIIGGSLYSDRGFSPSEEGNLVQGLE